MRRSWKLVAALFLLTATCRSSAASDFSGFGPIPTRNFQPIQQIFLNLPFERARVQAPGHFSLHLESAESNEIATEQIHVDAVLKFEQNRTVLGGVVGVLPGLEVGIDIPFISRFGGFLDPPIDSIEDLFGVRNPERTLYPNNSFGAYYARRGNTTLFNGEKQYLELGDLWLSSKYEVWQREGWPLVAVRAAIKAPTGRSSSVFGSGKPDFGLGVALEQQPLSWLMIYGNVSLIYPVGPITAGDLTLDPIVTEGIAFEGYLGRGVSLLFQQELYSSPFHGTGTPVLDGTVIELAAGLNWYWQPLLLQLGAIDNVSGVAQAADFTLMLRLTWFAG